MRLSDIFVFFALSLIFDSACAWWAAARGMIEPITLSFGAAFASLGLNYQPSNNVQQLFDVKEWFINKFDDSDMDIDNETIEYKKKL